VVAVLTVTADPSTDKSGPVRTRADLAAILPLGTSSLLSLHSMYDPRMVAALRLLAETKSSGWRTAINLGGIDTGLLLSWARSVSPGRDRLLAEAALAFLDPDVFHLSLVETAQAFCEDDDFDVLVDALRIAREGLAS
jgi:hypothetical protein